jgi:hypothetical protein
MMVAMMGLKLASPLVDRHDQDGPHHAPEEVAAEGGSVAPPQDDVPVHQRTVSVGRDLTHQAEHLDLSLVERYLVEASGLQVEEADRGALEPAYGGERGDLYVVLAREAGESFDCLLAGVRTPCAWTPSPLRRREPDCACDRRGCFV